jgi:hypothetical protein
MLLCLVAGLVREIVRCVIVRLRGGRIDTGQDLGQGAPGPGFVAPGTVAGGGGLAVTGSLL